MKGPFFSQTNFRLLGLSIALLVVGFILLGQGPVQNHLSWSVAPVLLVGVYCVLVPITILYKKKEDEPTAKEKKDT